MARGASCQTAQVVTDLVISPGSWAMNDCMSLSSGQQTMAMPQRIPYQVVSGHEVDPSALTIRGHVLVLFVVPTPAPTARYGPQGRPAVEPRRADPAVPEIALPGQSSKSMMTMG